MLAAEIYQHISNSLAIPSIDDISRIVPADDLGSGNTRILFDDRDDLGVFGAGRVAGILIHTSCYAHDCLSSVSSVSDKYSPQIGDSMCGQK
jgi:hypothetical protein